MMKPSDDSGLPASLPIKGFLYQRGEAIQHRGAVVGSVCEYTCKDDRCSYPRIVVKTPRDDPKMETYFEREVKIFREYLTNKDWAPKYVDDGRFREGSLATGRLVRYLATEFAEGRKLSLDTNSEGFIAIGVPKPKRWEIIGRLAHILQEAHSAKVTQRDWKESDVLISEGPEGLRIVLVDWNGGEVETSQSNFVEACVRNTRRLAMFLCWIAGNSTKPAWRAAKTDEELDKELSEEELEQLLGDVPDFRGILRSALSVNKDNVGVVLEEVARQALAKAVAEREALKGKAKDVPDFGSQIEGKLTKGAFDEAATLVEDVCKSVGVDPQMADVLECWERQLIYLSRLKNIANRDISAVGKVAWELTEAILNKNYGVALGVLQGLSRAIQYLRIGELGGLLEDLTPPSSAPGSVSAEITNILSSPEEYGEKKSVQGHLIQAQSSLEQGNFDGAWQSLHTAQGSAPISPEIRTELEALVGKLGQLRGWKGELSSHGDGPEHHKARLDLLCQMLSLDDRNSWIVGQIAREVGLPQEKQKEGGREEQHLADVLNAPLRQAHDALRNGHGDWEALEKAAKKMIEAFAREQDRGGYRSLSYVKPLAERYLSISLSMVRVRDDWLSNADYSTLLQTVQEIKEKNYIKEASAFAQEYLPKEGIEKWEDTLQFLKEKSDEAVSLMEEALLATKPRGWALWERNPWKSSPSDILYRGGWARCLDDIRGKEFAFFKRHYPTALRAAADNRDFEGIEVTKRHVGRAMAVGRAILAGPNNQEPWKAIEIEIWKAIIEAEKQWDERDPFLAGYRRVLGREKEASGAR